MSKKYTVDMCHGPLFKNIIVYTVPIILTSILQLLFNAADLVVVGRFCGSIYLGAVGATTSITSLIVNLFIGISVGAGVTVAHGIGAGMDDEVHRIVHTAIPTAFVSGAVMTVIGLVFARDFLELMDTPSDVIDLSTVYMRIYFCGMISTMLYNFGTSILRAAGDTKSPLIYLTIAGILNVILNIFFVTVFDMNVAGVALATSISQTLSAVLVLIALTKRTDACKLILSKMRFYKRHLVRILRIGIPSGLQGSLFAISNVLIQSSVNSFGAVVVSGNAAGANIESFVFVVMNAFNQTAMNFVGQNVGAGKYDRVKKIFPLCLICVLVAGIVFGGAAYIFSEPLLSIYITDSAEAIFYGSLRLLYICVPYFLLGLMDVTTGAIRGMGVAVAPMIVSVLGVCGFRIVWIYTVFRTINTLESLYISYSISWLLTAVVQAICFIVIYRSRTKKLKNT